MSTQREQEAEQRYLDNQEPPEVRLKETIDRLNMAIRVENDPERKKQLQAQVRDKLEQYNQLIQSEQKS